MKSKLNSVLILGSGLFLLILPLVSAYWGGGYSGWGPNFRPADLLENEWTIFVILFAIFYTTIFASLGKVFHENKAVPAILALAISFLVTAGIQKQWMFLEQPIMLWALILAVLLVLLTFFRAMKIGPVMFFGVLFLLAGLWGSIGDSMGVILPYGAVSFLDSINNFRWIILIAGIALIGYGLAKTHSMEEK